MSKELIGIIGIALVVIAYAPYIFDIIRNKAKPHPFSWLIWTITSVSMFILQTLHGSGSGAYPLGVVSVFALTIAILAFYKSKVVITKSDIVCLVLALIGIIFWLVVRQPLVSVVLLLLVDLVGFAPTLRKGWRAPYEDSISLWGINFFRQFSSILAIQKYNPITLMTPLAWMILSASLCIVLIVRRMDTKKAKNRKRVFRPYM